MATQFNYFQNNAKSSLASAYTAGSGSLVLADASSFGSTFPIEITVITAASYQTSAETQTIYKITGVSGNTLTGITVAEGETDQNFSVGDVVEMRWTAGEANLVSTAINNLENTGYLTPTGSGSQLTGITGSQIIGNISGLAGNPLTPTAVQTSGYTAAVGQIVLCNTTSGSFTVTLPAAPVDKSVLAVKHIIQGSTNTVTIAAGGSDVFNKTGGSATETLTLVNQGIALQYQAIAGIWIIVGDDMPLGSLDARYALLASPALTGVPTAPTATGGTNTTQIATTAFVEAALGGSGAVTSVFGRTGAVAATSGDYTVSQVTGAAPIASPTFTGTVTVPTGLTGLLMATSGVVSAATSGTDYAPAAGDSSIVTVGTIATGTWAGTTIAPAHGGTGLATLTAHGVMLGEGTSNVGFATIGTAGNLLLDQGSGADPVFEAMSGDATITSGGVITVGAGAITLAKQANFTASALQGNPTGSSAAPSAITLASNMGFVGTTLRGSVPIWAASGAGSPLTNSTAATSLITSTLGPSSVGSLTIAANTLQVGHRLRFSLFGTWSGTSTGSPKLTLTMLLGGSTLAYIQSGALSTTFSGYYWFTYSDDCGFFVQSTGSSGKIIGLGGFNIATVSAGIYNASGSAMQAPSQISINTTNSLAVDFQATWSYQATAETITLLGGAIYLD